MAERLPVEETNISGYGADVIPWSVVREAISAKQEMDVPYYLGTVRADGRPHVAGIGPIWIDGDFYIVSGTDTQKSKNLMANPACTLAARLPGLDVTIEGRAKRVDDAATLARVAATYRDGGWPAEVDGDALTAPYSAPSAGPPPWHVYCIRIESVVAITIDEKGGATRWRFAD